jgi:hypothetical protein
MAVTEYQRAICRLVARSRIESGVSYVAGGVALNTLTESPRVSQDIDVFHDVRESVGSSWNSDRTTLEKAGYSIHLLRERDTFVEATVSKSGETVVLQWALDSAFRFFPLIQHEDFGLALHPFDLATNKVLALVGRLEARDWVDTIRSHEKIQRLGYLAWAASGKDPGFSPAAILEQAGRSARYSAIEIAALSFSDTPPDAAALSQNWRAMLEEARAIVTVLPASQVGKCVLDSEGHLFSQDLSVLSRKDVTPSLRFHEGSLHGAWPTLRGSVQG